MICTKAGFIFIHIPRTGGTSMQNRLQLWLQKQKQINKRIGGRSKHWLASELEAQWLEQEDLFTFSFVRNPWSRMVSLYHWGVQLSRKQDWRDVSFETWLRSGLWKKRYSHTYMDWLKRDGEIFPQFIGRFENLHEDWAKVCKEIGINKPNLEKHRSTTHEEYKKYYNATSKKIVAKYFSEDIEYFNYDF